HLCLRDKGAPKRARSNAARGFQFGLVEGRYVWRFSVSEAYTRAVAALSEDDEVLRSGGSQGARWKV
ncbi:MAG: hypothetical protein O2954_11515, partial [bacterium]|nr:hypothetical protein [bacterium]